MALSCFGYNHNFKYGLNENKIELTTVLTKEDRLLKETELLETGCVPESGYEFKAGQLRKAGDYLLGPILGSSPVKSMVQCLGRKSGTDQFYTVKILTVRENEDETQDDRQGKMLLHTEHSLLSFLDGQSGILKQHGLFQDYVCDADPHTDDRMMIGNGKLVRRICLVLDCLYPHEYNRSSSNYINLQHYVIGKRKLMELDAFTIFYNIVSVVNKLHELNVIHRDIKLANLVLNQQTRQVTLINFCLGQHLVSENDRLQDQRGSPAYISPDVLMGKPYLGKPSDMWALGVLLFTMLFGQFPFYHKFHQELFKMIKTASYTFPSDAGVKSDTLDIIRGLLLLDPNKRLTAHQVLVKLSSIISARLSPDNFPSYDAQIVPDLDLSGDEHDDEMDDQIKTKNLSIKSKTDTEENSINDLDYYINRTTPETPLDKKIAAYPTFSSVLMKNLPTCLNSGEGTRSSNSISVNEGDTRSFTHVDLYLHRNLFPRYSGPELIRWRASKERMTPALAPTSVNPLGRAAVANVPQSSAVRMVSNGAAAVSSMDIPPINSSQNMYEFPPARRWALAILQQLKDSPEEKPPSVPQMDLPISTNDAVPSTSKIIDLSVIPSKGNAPGKVIKSSGDCSSTVQTPATGSSESLSKKINLPECSNGNPKAAKIAKLSKTPSQSSSLAERRLKTKSSGKLLEFSPFFKLATQNNSSTNVGASTSSSNEHTAIQVNDDIIYDDDDNSNRTNTIQAIDVPEVANINNGFENRHNRETVDNTRYMNADSSINDEINSNRGSNDQDNIDLGSP